MYKAEIVQKIGSAQDFAKQNKLVSRGVEAASLAIDVARSLAFVTLNSREIKDTVLRDTIRRDYPLWDVSMRTKEQEDGSSKTLKVFTRTLSDLSSMVKNDIPTSLLLSDEEHFDDNIVNIFRETKNGEWVDYIAGNMGPTEQGLRGSFTITIEDEPGLEQVDLQRIERVDAYLQEAGYTNGHASLRVVAA